MAHLFYRLILSIKQMYRPGFRSRKPGRFLIQKKKSFFCGFDEFAQSR